VLLPDGVAWALSVVMAFPFTLLAFPTVPWEARCEPFSVMRLPCRSSSVSERLVASAAASSFAAMSVSRLLAPRKERVAGWGQGRTEIKPCGACWGDRVSVRRHGGGGGGSSRSNRRDGGESNGGGKDVW